MLSVTQKPIYLLTYFLIMNIFIRNPAEIQRKHLPKCMSACVRSHEGCRGFTDRTWAINQLTMSLMLDMTNGLQNTCQLVIHMPWSVGIYSTAICTDRQLLDYAFYLTWRFRDLALQVKGLSNCGVMCDSLGP